MYGLLIIVIDYSRENLIFTAKNLEKLHLYDIFLTGARQLG